MMALVVVVAVVAAPSSASGQGRSAAARDRAARAGAHRARLQLSRALSRRARRGASPSSIATPATGSASSCPTAASAGSTARRCCRSRSISRASKALARLGGDQAHALRAVADPVVARRARPSPAARSAATACSCSARRSRSTRTSRSRGTSAKRSARDGSLLLYGLDGDILLVAARPVRALRGARRRRRHLVPQGQRRHADRQDASSRSTPAAAPRIILVKRIILRFDVRNYTLFTANSTENRQEYSGGLAVFF